MGRRCPEGRSIGLFALCGVVVVTLLVVITGCSARPSDREPGPRSGATDFQSSAEIAGGLGEVGGTGLDRIAYTGADGGLFTIDPDGTNSRRLAGEEFLGSAGGVQAQPTQSSTIYYWPTWSPRGDKLAVSRVVLEESGARASIHLVDPTDGALTFIYENEPDVLPLIAPDAPHYLYWAPDGNLLTFIASTPRGLTLLAAPLGGQGDPVTLITQGPIYYSWASDSSSILMHRGRDLLLARSPQLHQNQELSNTGVGFRTPAFSPSGNQAAYVAPSDDHLALFILDTGQNTAPVELLQVGLNTAFLWSPDGQVLAVADTASASGGVYEGVRLIGVGGGGERVLVDEPVLAFFWSPDGSQILYVTVSAEQRALAWKVIPMGGGVGRVMTEFVPSPEMFTMLSFFDQYAYSHAVWSPDSSKFVFAGALRGGAARGNGAEASADKIYVVDVASATVQQIASGRLGFWSWN